MWRKTSAVGPLSTMRPAYITIMRSVVSAITPRSWVIMISDMPVSCTTSEIRSRICAWMVTSSAVVGSSAIRISGSQASAAAIITRCRCPPDSW